jgi:hypothetical protein
MFLNYTRKIQPSIKEGDGKSKADQEKGIKQQSCGYTLCFQEKAIKIFNLTYFSRFNKTNMLRNGRILTIQGHVHSPRLKVLQTRV